MFIVMTPVLGAMVKKGAEMSTRAPFKVRRPKISAIEYEKTALEP